ncbi:MAG: dihydroorotase [Clostridia bacterium]|nr:dihydroorotase [Clostridia bacterium]
MKCIVNGTVVLKDKEIKADVLINDGGRIEKIGSFMIPAGCEVTDAAGKYVLPGIIDMHVHFREPGYEGKEDIETGSRAAAHGGVTQVACMPNTDPVCDNAVVVSYIVHRAKEVGLCKVHPVGAITKGQKGEALADIGKMKNAGAIALSEDGKSVMNSQIMRLGMEYGNGFGLKCLCHCEDINLADGGCVNEGFNSTMTGLKGIPRAAEDIIISRDICLAESIGCPVHICHVSTWSGVEIIRAAKVRGVKVTAETCPHYFALTDDCITSFNTFTKVNPPIREEKDRQAIIRGLKDGTLDCIVTDHAPHALKDKQVEYSLASFGISGIETSFALSYTYLVKSGVMTLPELMQKMSYVPAQILRLEGGEIKEGAPADLFIADLDATYKIDSSAFLSKGKNTPFIGMEVSGKVCKTFMDGRETYSE